MRKSGWGEEVLQSGDKDATSEYHRSTASKWGPFNDTIDLRFPDEEVATGLIEDLVGLPVDDKEPSKVLKLGNNLFDDLREAISTFLKKNLDVVA